ncbi:MAG TPA: hypothetical protein VFG51_00280 [Candidatus Saccharimonadia bacterium]|nr:hypothetical protein [Candidatus Saccharimonadia bacterium]
METFRGEIKTEKADAMLQDRLSQLKLLLEVSYESRDSFLQALAQRELAALPFYGTDNVGSIEYAVNFEGNVIAYVLLLTQTRAE